MKIRGKCESNNSIKRRLVDEICRVKSFFHKQAVANRFCHQQLLELTIKYAARIQLTFLDTDKSYCFPINLEILEAHIQKFSHGW